MATAEVQTSFDTVRLDSYGSSSSSHVSQDDVRRIAQRRESFRKSRGTSIVTTATFSSIGLDDDDAFLADDVPYDELTVCGRNTPVEGLEEIHQQEYKDRSRQHVLRRSGTFPSISPPKSAQHSSNTPSLLQDNVPLTDKRNRLVSGKMYSIDMEWYDNVSNRCLSSNHDSDPKGVQTSSKNDTDSGENVSSHNSSVLQIDSNISQSDSKNESKTLLPVCAETIVPSDINDTVTESARTVIGENVGKSSIDPVHIEYKQASTEPTNQPFPQCNHPTLESWDTSNLSSCSRSPESEPFHNYSPVLSPPPSMPDEVAQTNSSTTVLPQSKESNQTSGSPSSVWQVTEMAHHLEQHRMTQNSPNPQSVCTSEVNARCEPIGGAAGGEERLRSSMEMEISGHDGANAEGLPKEKCPQNAGLTSQVM